MKRTKTFYLAAFLLIFTVGLCSNVFAQSTDLKIGFVDLQRVIDSSEEGKRAQEQIKQKAGELEIQARQMQEEMQTLRTSYENQFEVLTLEARSQKRDEISRLERDYARFVQDSQNELRLIEQRALKQLLENVGRLVVEYGKQNNFTVILEASNILYGISQIEITEDIIQLYNTQ